MWWTTMFIRGHHGFSTCRAATLITNKMGQVKDIWDEPSLSFLPWDTAWLQFKMHDDEAQAYNKLLLSIVEAWILILTTNRSITRKQEFIGFSQKKLTWFLACYSPPLLNSNPILHRSTRRSNSPTIIPVSKLSTFP